MNDVFDDFQDNLSELGFDIEYSPKLISCVLKAMAKTATTGILSSEYSQKMSLDESMQINMLDEALGDYEGMMNSISEKIEKEFCEEDSEPT